MKRIRRNVVALLGLVAALGLCVAPASAQSPEAKEKPPLYTYVSNWDIPRARWDDMQKAGARNQKILDAAVANNTILGHGDGQILVHQADGARIDGGLLGAP